VQRSSVKAAADGLAQVACCAVPLLLIAVVAGAIPLIDALIVVAAVGVFAGGLALWARRCAI